MLFRGIRVALCCASFAAALLFSGCVGPTSIGTSSPTPSYSASLPGNWLLLGSLPIQGPTQFGAGVPTNAAISLDVSNGQVIGAASMQLPCTTAVGALSVTYGAALSGTLASDGSFKVASPANSVGNISLSLSGTAPTAAGVPWKGTLVLTVSPVAGSPTACTANASLPFTAIAMADVSGTFSGSGTAAFLPSQVGGTGISPQQLPLMISTTLSQGGLLSAIPVGTSSTTSRLGLNGTIDIQGISCFRHGSSAGLGGVVEGGTAVSRFLMDDGSTLVMSAQIGDVAADQLYPQTLIVVGGNCAGDYIALSTNPLLLKK